MAVEINGLSQTQTQHSSDNQKVSVGRNDASAPKQETGGSTAQDTVTLTDTAAGLSNIHNTAAQLPVTDSNRVEALRQAIADGSYEVDAERVADKLVQAESDLV